MENDKKYTMEEAKQWFETLTVDGARLLRNKCFGSPAGFQWTDENTLKAVQIEQPYLVTPTSQTTAEEKANEYAEKHSDSFDYSNGNVVSRYNDKEKLVECYLAGYTANDSALSVVGELENIKNKYEVRISETKKLLSDEKSETAQYIFKARN